MTFGACFRTDRKPKGPLNASVSHTCQSGADRCMWNAGKFHTAVLLCHHVILPACKGKSPDALLVCRTLVLNSSAPQAFHKLRCRSLCLTAPNILILAINGLRYYQFGAKTVREKVTRRVPPIRSDRDQHKFHHDPHCDITRICI